MSDGVYRPERPNYPRPERPAPTITRSATQDLWWWDSWAWRVYLATNREDYRTCFGANGSLVVSLDEQMWSRISKGHRAAIRAAERDGITVIDSFGGYREVHLLANGFVRPESTFDVQRGWIGRCGLALTAMHQGLLPAAAFFVYEGAGAYYFSGPRNPNIEAPGAAHLLIWTAMQKLKDLGVRWLDMGAVPDDDPKHQSIAHFKKLFGATVRIWPNYLQAAETVEVRA